VAPDISFWVLARGELVGFALGVLGAYADDWLIVCRSRSEAERALASARAVLEGELGLRLHPEKTRIVHITRGFEFLGYKVGRGRGLRHKAGGPSLYALPTDRSIKRFKDKVRTATNRRNPKDLEGVLAELNPIIRGWGNYYRRAHVRRLFNRLNHWIVMRVWNHQHKHWRNAGWRHLPDRRLYRGAGPGQPPATDSEHGELLPPEGASPVRAACGKTARAVRKGGRR